MEEVYENSVWGNERPVTGTTNRYVKKIGSLCYHAFIVTEVFLLLLHNTISWIIPSPRYSTSPFVSFAEVDYDRFSLILTLFCTLLQRCFYILEQKVSLSQGYLINWITPQSFPISHHLKCFWINTNIWCGIISNHIRLANVTCSNNWCYLLTKI